MAKIPNLVRALVWATLCISFFLVFLPIQVLRWSGITERPVIAKWQVIGMALVVIGGLLAIACVVTFGTIGEGTPAPFDPPKKLVIRGPYRFVRNPMYIGALLALGGASLFYTSLPLFGFTITAFVVLHLFVIYYEEPTLKRTFGADYEQYLQNVRRWLPTFHRSRT